MTSIEPAPVAATPAMMKRSITLCSFGGYRLFCESWWSDLTSYVFGVGWTARYSRTGWWWRTLCWRTPGWCYDIFTYWHRARYGWAPRDTWGLDGYLNGVLAGSLVHLADTACGAPAGYGCNDGITGETNFEKWDADLRRWALAFYEDPEDVDIYDTPDYVKHRAEEDRRRYNLQRALAEIAPYWQSLWN